MDKPAPSSDPAADGPRTTSTPTILYRRPNAQSPTAPATPTSPETLISLEAPVTPTMPAIPEISDYWPDAPYQRISRNDGITRITHHPHSRAGEPGATSSIGGTPQRPARPAEAPQRRRGRRPLQVILAALLLAGVGLVGTRLVPYFRSSSGTGTAAPTTQPVTGRPPAATAEATTPPAAQPSAPVSSHTLSGPTNGRSDETFELVSDANSVNLRAADLGADLYRITTPDNSAAPQVKTTDEGIQLSLIKSRGHTDTTVEVVLNAKIRWRLTMTGGSRSSVLNLAGTTVESVDLNGGVTRIDLTLPRPTGTLPVRMSGGANQFRIITTGTAEARVRARKGAGKVVFNGRTDNGVAKGATFVSRDFADSDDRIDVDAIGGFGTLIFGPA